MFGVVDVKIPEALTLAQAPYVRSLTPTYVVGGRETSGDEVFLIHSVLLRALPYEAVEYAVKSTHSRCVGNRV